MNDDTEIEAMATLARVLEGLSEQARLRVLSWAISRYGRASGSHSPDSAPQTLGTVDDRVAFGTLAELFDAAEPKTDKEKALVSAYWTQVCQGQPSFASQIVNSNLKDLGHGVANITVSLGQLKDERPALIHQIKKAGTSQQARKTYKLTAEGARRVRGMLAKEDS
ncbi:MAG: hypothetical protein U1E67_23590 [Hyphomicrobiales bacterium]